VRYPTKAYHLPVHMQLHTFDERELRGGTFWDEIWHLYLAGPKWHQFLYTQMCFSALIQLQFCLACLPQYCFLLQT